MSIKIGTSKDRRFIELEHHITSGMVTLTLLRKNGFKMGSIQLSHKKLSRLLSELYKLDRDMSDVRILALAGYSDGTNLCNTMEYWEAIDYKYQKG